MQATEVRQAVDGSPVDMGAVKPDLDDEDGKAQDAAPAAVDDPESEMQSEQAPPAATRRRRHPWRDHDRRAIPLSLKIASGLVAYLALMGLAFYAGMSHQSSADQQLYADYHPATGSARGAGVGGSANSLVAAALSIGNPPGSVASGSAAASPQPTAAAGGGQGAVPTSSTLGGQLAGVSSRSLSIQTSQGSAQTLAIASSTRFYTVDTVHASALAAGQRVVASISRDSSGASTATAITISPAGTILVDAQSTKQLQDPGSLMVGAITAVGKDSLTVQTSQGTSLHVRLSTTTPVYRVDQATSGQMKAGLAVAAQATAVDGQAVASSVVVSNIPGISLRLSAPR